MGKVNFFWFRRDLRLEDNAGLYHALLSKNPVIPLFLFDSDILDKIDDPQDARVQFIHLSLKNLQTQLIKLGSSLVVKHGQPLEIWKDLLKEYEIEEVYINHDYEPYAITRDKAVSSLLKDFSVPLFSYKDQVIFEKSEVLKDNNQPYTVFTPYSKKWKSLLNDFFLTPYPNHKYFENFYKTAVNEIPSLERIGFKDSGVTFPKNGVSIEIIKTYKETRNFPFLDATSRLSVHLRFGTIGIRSLVQSIRALSEEFLNELIWREFFMMILYHFPSVVEHSFKKEYDRIPWRNNEKEFDLWCNGKTGYPIVDAGMRELNQTGFMHNRVRLITASFLCKHLLIDWRWGERYFSEKLLDYELSSNNGNWQWAAGSGCDAAPYFRIFNPYIQTQKFDKQLQYINKWVPELNSKLYPQPIVDHDFARKRAIEVYSSALKQRVA